MPRTDPDPLSAGQQWRLRIALDRVMPPFSPPRYQSLPATGIRAWRLAPASLALGIVGVLALSAYAATGSTNPAVWGQRAQSTIQAVRLAPATPPVVAPPPSAAAQTATGPVVKPTHQANQKPEPSDKDQHSGSNQQTAASGARHGSPPTPSPTPSQSQSPEQYPWDH